MEFLQPFFRRQCNDDLAGLKSFMYGKSTSNQRIEVWWSILRRQCTDWWICIFKDLRDRGVYDSLDPLHNQCIKFCFMDILQRELHRIAMEWNLHSIRSKRNNECPPGKPDALYFTPGLSDSRDYGTQVAVEDVAICKELYTKEKPNDYDQDFLELIQLLRPNLVMPTSADDALALYVGLIHDIDEYTNIE